MSNYYHKGSKVTVPGIGTEPHFENMRFSRSTKLITASAETLTAEDFGKICFVTMSTGSDVAITLPAPTAGGVLTFINQLTPSGTGDLVITAPTTDTIVAMSNGDADADGASNLLADTVTIEAASVGGERIEFVADGTYWYCFALQNVIGSITFAG